MSKQPTMPNTLQLAVQEIAGFELRMDGSKKICSKDEKYEKLKTKKAALNRIKKVVKDFASIMISDEEAESVYNVIHSNQSMVGYFDLKFTSDITIKQARIWELYFSDAWGSIEEKREGLEFLSACLKSYKGVR